MTSLQSLIAQQEAKASEIERAVANIKKTPQDRRTLEFYRIKYADLTVLWQTFERTENLIRRDPTLSEDDPYVIKNMHKIVGEMFSSAMTYIEGNIQKLTTSKPVLSAEEKGVEKSPGTSLQHQAIDAANPTTDTTELLKLVRRQAAIIASLERLLEGEFATQDVVSATALWQNIEDLHFKIYEDCSSPVELGYDLERFIRLEKKFRDAVKAVNTNSARLYTNEYANRQPEPVPLPKITLPKFDGNYLKWQEFHDLFSSLIISQPMPKVQYMWYLKTHLAGEAANLIKHFTVTGENFEAAWAMVVERYNNKRLLVSKLIQELVDAPSKTNDNFKTLHDKTQECLLALQNLNIDTSTWDPLLLHLLLKKLDQPTRLRYEQSLSQPQEVPTMKEFLNFLKGHFQSMEAMTDKEKPINSRAKVCTSAVSTISSKSCIMCKNGIHPLFTCKEFLKLSPLARLQFIQKERHCINCLKAGHTAKNCVLRSCVKCSKRHNTLLHLENTNQNLNNSSSTSATSALATQEATALTAATHSTHEYVLLSTAMVNIRANGKEVQCRALLDSGSQLNLVSERLIKRLGISSQPASIHVSGIGSNSTKVQHRVNVALHSQNSSFTTRLEAAVLPQIIAPQPSRAINIDNWPLPSNISLADPHFNRPDKIDVLLGAEFHHQLLTVGQIKLAKDLPMLQNTVLGWVIGGKVGKIQSSSAVCGMYTTDETNLENAIAQLWELENVKPADKLMSSSEKHCEAHFSETHTIEKGGRFVVRIPFCDNPNALGESHGIAYNRFLSLERRLTTNSEIKAQYVHFREEYEALGHMTQIDINSAFKPHYFIPHHCVLRPESLTTKLRVVFDASTKTSAGVSLNDLMHTGPTVQSELFSILLRFRLPRFVFTTDIEKMYRQILIHPEDRKFQLILWREDPKAPIKYYQLNTVTYGTRAAPYLATKCLETIARENIPRHPYGAQFLLNNFYVDDGLGGDNDLSTALKMQQELREILQQHGLKLQKWSANHPHLLKNVTGGIDTEVNIDFQNENNHTVKTLGLTWMPTIDKFCVKVCLNKPQHITKRTVSSDLARLFDPLGILAPVVVTAKIFIQELWQLKLTWDEALPAELHMKWMTFRNEMEHINNMKISRHILEGHVSPHIQIHGFADASERAYGAAIYVRSIIKNGQVIVRLLCAKSRVAPLKRQTLPRLELCAALLCAQLINRVKGDLKLENTPTYLWTDSEIVLAWINSQSASYHTFVANRIAAIQELSSPEQWRHVNSKDNPADILSRGLSPRKLPACALWLYGPIFLHGQKETWPQNHPNTQSIDENDINMERKKIIAVTTTSDSSTSVIYNIQHNGSFRTLQRIVGYVLRFINKTRRRTQQADLNLTVQELEQSLMVIIREIQREEFEQEIRQLKGHNEVKRGSPYSNLAPFLDTNGIIRVGGRLTSAILPYDAKHPMLIPYNDPISKLLMQMIHEQNRHCGPQALLAHVRQRYWPIKGKSAARSIVQHCIRCTRAKPQLLGQMMGNLPSSRVSPARPFITSGVDFCGPFWVHYKIRGKKPQKAYIAVFCCFATKAVHLELVSDLTTEAFIGALKRFVSRRGHCQTLYCDNATNFVGANNQLKELSEAIYASPAHEVITKECASKSITFRFIPPRAPHFGGLWEAAVKSAKHLLVRSVSTASLTYEELHTVVTEIEGILNSRPISPLSSDPNDLAALTPGHFLIGEPLNAHVDVNATQPKVNLLTRWKLVTHLKGEFWKRWSREYLCELQYRHKWKTQHVNAKPGDMVIIKEDNTPPLQWPLGRIIKVHYGDDGLVRVAEVKTSNGICKRPIARLAPLPVNTTEVTTETPYENNANQPDINQSERPESLRKRRRTSIVHNIFT